MNPVRVFQLFLLKVLLLGAAAGSFISLLQPQLSHLRVLGPLVERPYIGSMVLSLLALSVDSVLIYPRFRDPLRNLPSIQGARNRGQILYESPRGKTALRWMEEAPDAQLIRTHGVAGLSPILVAGPDALRDILNTHAYDFEKPYGVRAFLGRAIGWGLIMSEGAEHRHQKKVLTPAFHVRRIRELYQLMWDKTRLLIREVEKEVAAQQGDVLDRTAGHGGPARGTGEHGDNHGHDGFGLVELSEWASRLTLDIIGPTAVGRDFGSLTSRGNAVADAFLELLRPDVRRLFFFSLHFMVPEWIVRILPLQENKILNEIGAFLRGVCSDIITEKKRELKQGRDLSSHDILSRIIQAGDFSDAEISDQMLTFLAAGHETTASALTWACYLCAKHPDIQDRLRAEIRAGIGSSEAGITPELLEGMGCLNGVCEETLRLYPTVPATVREAVRDTHVAGYAVPRGTDFLLVPYAVNRNARFWPDPHAFVPDRWIDAASGRPNHSGGAASNLAELTFLHGPRACIGRDFAKAELRCAVAGVVGRFQIALHTLEEPRVQGVITMKPEGGMYLRFRPVPGW